MALRPYLQLLLMVVLSATGSHADTWRENVWHFVCEESPFFAQDRADRHSAGVVTSDGGFALMVLGDPLQGALVSINVPDEMIKDRVTSTLIMPTGNVFSRTVTDDQFWAVQTPDGASVTYTFRVDPADIEFFQAGRRWQVKAGATTRNVPLKGSRVAIRSALTARATQSTACSEQIKD